MKNKLNETGRSMVEMLGVIAVIGVLSVAGIMGYKYGMMKYRVNETVNELNIMANTYGIQMQQMTEEQTMPTDGELLSEEGAITRMGYGYEVLGFDDHFEITLFDIPTEICEQLQKTGWAMPYDIQVAEVTAETCGEIVYYINNDLSGFAPETNNSDEDDTDEEETPLDCGLYGTPDGNKCICDEGYSGHLCNQCDTSKGYKKQDSNGKCYLDCQITNSCTIENYCNGNAFQMDIYDGLPYCKHCKEGYWGTHCENYDPSGNACNGQSLGYGWMNSPYVNGCQCDDGYWGDHCEYSNNEITPCYGRGTLQGYGFCVCERGFSGEYCENEEPSVECGIIISTDSYSSTKSGYMIYENGTARCQCAHGYTGSDCKTPPTSTCSSGQWDYSQGQDNPLCGCSWGACGPNCAGYGTYAYVNGVNVCTSCRDGYTGENCTIRPTQNCNYPKTWYYTDKNTVVCGCRHGYVGASCNIQCRSSNGTWKLENGVATCECLPGKTGEDCTENS